MEEKKEKIASMIKEALLQEEITLEQIKEKIEIPKDRENGDFAYPCFHLAKMLKKAPIQIAEELRGKIVLIPEFSKIESVNGFLNFYVNSSDLVGNVLSYILEKKEAYGKDKMGEGKTILVDYSSPNIAKPFHLGHFRNTVLGSALYHLYENLGYHVIGINYLGDWGRQFGLLIEGYELYKDEYDMTKDPLEALSKIYMKINQLAKEDETIMEKARQIFKKLEEGEERYVKLWEYFREISLKEYNRLYQILGCHFDSYQGEAFYSDKIPEVIEILEQKKVLEESQGAKVVKVGENIPPCMIVQSNGSSIYATRDLASILYRVRTYDFTKAIYVTGSEQILHFKQIFEVAKYLIDETYRKGLVHVSYGMIRLKTGKMSTREGNVIQIRELLEEAIEKSKKILCEKNANLENRDVVARQVGVGALIFNYLKTSKNKDIIFDLDETLRFDGETGPYIQYTYVRTQAILKKAGFHAEEVNKMDYTCLQNKEEIELIKSLQKYGEIIKKAAMEYEPSVLARYLIEVATLYSKFYNECSVLLAEDEKQKRARCALTYGAGIVLKNGLSILGIECPDRM